jgi:hypothetical protein
VLFLLGWHGLLALGYVHVWLMGAVSLQLRLTDHLRQHQLTTY